jgi:hypothetical protein
VAHQPVRVGLVGNHPGAELGGKLVVVEEWDEVERALWGFVDQESPPACRRQVERGVALVVELDDGGRGSASARTAVISWLQAHYTSVRREERRKNDEVSARRDSNPQPSDP